MIGESEFLAGLAYLAHGIRRGVYEPTQQAVFFDQLVDETTAEEWREFSRWAIKVARWTDGLPSVADIRDGLRAFRGERPIDAEVIEAYERVIASGIYAAEGGTTWNFRRVVDTCGRAAAEAFLEAGGHHAFVTTWNESERRAKFIAAYSAAARADRTTRLLPAAPQGKLLTAPQDDDEPLTRAEVSQLMRPSAPARPRPPRQNLTESQWEERRARLLDQAKELAE